MQDNIKISVLLVEDSEDDALLTVMELRDGGYDLSFERVESFGEMKKAIEEKQWDLIISDFSLPEFNGPDALRLYKEKELDIPFIVVSGAIGEETAISLMHEGAHDYIMKDNLARLVPAVQREIREAFVRVEQRQAAKALKESETRYRMLAENVADLIWTTDLKLKMTYITPSISEMLGYQPDEAMTLPLKKFLTRNSFRECMRLYRNQIEAEKVYDTDRDRTLVVELELIRKDGSAFWTESKMSFLRNGDGIPVGIIGVVRDIDALKMSEEDLMRTLEDSLKSKLETEALLESTHSVLVNMPFEWKARKIFDFCRGIIGATAGYVYLLSRDGDRSEVLFIESGGLSCTIDPSLPIPIGGLSEEVYETGTTIFENDFRNSKWNELLPKGHFEHVNVMFAPLLVSGRVAGFLGFANKSGGFIEEDVRVASAFADIASIALLNSRTLELLEKSEHQYKNLFSSINDVIIVADNNRNIIDANQPALRNQFGYELDEVVGRQTTLLYANEKGLEQIGQIIYDSNDVEVGKIIEVDFMKKNGEVFPSELYALKLFDEGNEVIGDLGIIRDITGKRKLQAERMRAAHLASLGELAAGVAHEINNPNAGIILNTQLLIDDLDMVAEERNDILRRIMGNSERIDKIVSKLLSFARTDSEERQSVDVIEITNEVHSLIARRFEKSGLKLVVSLPDGLPRIWANPQQIEQIFMNFCTNSLQAMKNYSPQPEREMHLDITGGTKDMDGKTYVQVMLNDNGPGIPEEIMTKVLDPFFTTKPKGQGTGLGLSISHEIIMNHDGNMELESVEGEFTTITISIPAMEMEHEA